MTLPVSISTSIIFVDGLVIHPFVNQKRYTGLEKGKMSTVNAIIIHETGAATAASTFNSYAGSGNGAHFLIDRKGTIYQTAKVNQKTYHVGVVKSRCDVEKSCSKAEEKRIKDIMHKKGLTFSTRVKNLHRHEKKKSYPERFPTNDDSIGIELVGSSDEKTKRYDTVTDKQNASMRWLIDGLQAELKLDDVDIFRHPTVSRKESSEASTAKW